MRQSGRTQKATRETPEREAANRAGGTTSGSNQFADSAAVPRTSPHVSATKQARA